MKKALVLSLVCVLGLAFSGFAASLTGSWDTDVVIDPTVADFSAAISLTSVIGVVYEVGDWAFTSTTKLTDAGWQDQDFGVTGVLGAFSITSALGFAPQTVAFESWKTTVGVSIAGVTFGSVFEIDGADAALALTGAGVAGDVSVNVAVTFGGLGEDDGCDLDWSGVVVTLGFPFCCADVSAEVAFDCSGFDYALFSVEDITIGNLPWLAVDASVKFEVDAKTVTLTPSIVPGAFGCITLDVAIDWDGGDQGALSLDGFIIDAIGLTCDIGAVTFTAKTDYSPADAYYEWYTLKTNDDACCGPFGFELGFYFLDGGAALFDLGKVEAEMTLQVATQFKFNMGLSIDVATDAFTDWTIGFLVTW